MGLVWSFMTSSTLGNIACISHGLFWHRFQHGNSTDRHVFFCDCFSTVTRMLYLEQKIKVFDKAVIFKRLLVKTGCAAWIISKRVQVELMRCLEKPVLRARTGSEISALHGNWSAVQPGGFAGDVVWQLHRPWKCAWLAKVNGAGWRFFGAILQSDLFERPAVPKIFVDMCWAWLFKR